MPDPKKFLMDYRPESYWDCGKEGFTNIKGEMRRRVLDGALAGGQLDLLPGSLLSDELSHEERFKMAAMHPSFMGGEFLPAYLAGELEIARVSLESVTWDVISVRAQKLDDGRISYRVVDEYESPFRCRPGTSAEPLTMSELISLIDSVEGHNAGFGDARGLTDSYRDYNCDLDRTLQHLNVLVHFVRVYSLYYPELESWYEAEAQEWYSKRAAELEAESSLD
jgi:hypothetical protein